MALSINQHLLQLAGKYYISNGSPEQIKIDVSVDTIKKNLKGHFSNSIKEIIEFGSYKRDTILPRKYDEYSDVDLMVVFNHAALKVTPETYRNYLIEFAKKYYSRSEFYKSSPTVVLELDHIKYDLVPAYEIRYTWASGRTLYIPQNAATWRSTDPRAFNAQQIAVNNRHNYHIKRVIRLLKAWNSKVGYPLSSYELEMEVTNNMLFFNCISLEDHFFYAIHWLSGSRPGNLTAVLKIQALKTNAQRVKTALSMSNMTGALLWLGHILPM